MLTLLLHLHLGCANGAGRSEVNVQGTDDDTNGCAVHHVVVANCGDEAGRGVAGRREAS